MTIPEQATPPPEKAKEEESGGGLLDRIRESIIDNYNGLYVIVLKPRMPESILYSIGILGVILGIIWAYVAAPAVWTGGNPNRLNESSQRQWLLMVAVGTSAQNLYGPEQTALLAQSVPNPRAQIAMMLEDPNISQNDRIALQSLLQQLPPNADENSASQITGGNFFVNFLVAWIVPMIIMVILIVVIVLLWRFLIYDNLVAPVLGKIAEMRDPELAARNQRSRDELEILRQQRGLREELAKDAGDAVLGEPVMTQLAIYTPGRMFDESYEIELESGEFLGQSGTVLAEAVDPDPIAIEVWLFDMASSKNITKIFVTPQGNADPAIRGRLDSSVDNPATDIIVADTASLLAIDTDKLRLQAKFASLEFNANGRFDTFKLQMNAWNKEGSAGNAAPPPPAPIAPAGVPDMSTYDDIQFDPPPPMSSAPAGVPDISTYDDIQFDPPPPMPSAPAGAPDMSTYDNIQFDPPPPMPASGSGSSDFLSPPPMTPLSPPPLTPPSKDEDDDPFGGTGDFTPLGGT